MFCSAFIRTKYPVSEEGHGLNENILLSRENKSLSETFFILKKSGERAIFFFSRPHFLLVGRERANKQIFIFGLCNARVNLYRPIEDIKKRKKIVNKFFKILFG